MELKNCSLLWIVSGVHQYSREKSALNTIFAFENKAILICVDKSVIEDYGEYGVHKFPFAVGKSGGCCSCFVVFFVFVLDSVW